MNSTARPTRYTVTLPDGKVARRASHRTYTHAIAVHVSGEAWDVVAFAGSLDLAIKSVAKYQGWRCWDEVRALPVKVSA